MKACSQKIDRMKLEEEAARLAGDPHVIRAIKAEHPNLRFISQLDVSKRRATSAFERGENPSRYDNTSFFSQPYKFSEARFFQRVTLRNTGVLLHPFTGNPRQQLSDLRKYMKAGREKSSAMLYPPLYTVVKDNPLLTPREDVALLANLPFGEFRPDCQVTSARQTAFTMRHEAQHDVSLDTWQGSVEDNGTKAPPQLAREKKGYNKLWQKVSQAEVPHDPYMSALSESMSDVAGTLGDLRDGNDNRYIHQLANARARRFYIYPSSYKYPTHFVLDYVAENADALKKRMNGMTKEDVEELTAEIVGENAPGREEYYQQVIMICTARLAEAQDVKMQDVDFNNVLQDKNSRLRHMWQTYHGESKTQWWKRDEQRAAEVYGVIKHVQDTHPELSGPEGAMELIHRREMLTKILYRESPAYYDELEAVEMVKGHLAEELNKDNERRLNQDFYSMAPGR